MVKIIKKEVFILTIVTLIFFSVNKVLADEFEESSLNFTFRLFELGWYFPEDKNIADVYTDSNKFLYGCEFNWLIFRELGAGLGFHLLNESGYALNYSNFEESADKAELYFLPLIEFNLTYRLILKNKQLIVPYGGGGFDIVLWKEDRESGSSVVSKTGVNSGYHFRGGGQLLLSLLQPSASKRLDYIWGINNTYLTFEFKYLKLNDFGRKGQIDLSGKILSLGIEFEI